MLRLLLACALMLGPRVFWEQHEDSLLPESTQDSCQKGCRWPETPKAHFQTGRGTSSNSPEMLFHLAHSYSFVLVLTILPVWLF